MVASRLSQPTSGPDASGATGIAAAGRTSGPRPARSPPAGPPENDGPRPSAPRRADCKAHLSTVASRPLSMAGQTFALVSRTRDAHVRADDPVWLLVDRPSARNRPRPRSGLAPAAARSVDAIRGSRHRETPNGPALEAADVIRRRIAIKYALSNSYHSFLTCHTILVPSWNTPREDLLPGNPPGALQAP
jgi:hypothetical protein